MFYRAVDCGPADSRFFSHFSQCFRSFRCSVDRKAVPTGDSVLGLFYGTAANPAMQSVPAARTIAGYDWSCQKLSRVT